MLYFSGLNILSTWIGSNSSVNTISGTSMATPHIAGLVATIISRDGNDTPAAISTKIQTLSTKGALSSIREHLFISTPRSVPEDCF